MNDANVAESGIEGLIVLRPLSPIEQPGTANFRPYQATVTVLDERGETVTQFQSDAEGRFRVALRPGRYVLRPESEQRYPYARLQTVTVSEGTLTSVQIPYDTGIRGPGAG